MPLSGSEMCTHVNYCSINTPHATERASLNILTRELQGRKLQSELKTQKLSSLTLARDGIVWS